MKVLFDESFLKSIKKLKNKIVEQAILEIINETELVENISAIKNVKKLRGFKTYYRIKFKDYRIGIELVDSSTILFIIVTHRKDIYTSFP